MPVFFGPSSISKRGPRNGKPAADLNTYLQPAEVEVIGVTYETDREVLESMIPDCYTLNDPFVSVLVCDFHYLGWAAGKSYNLVNVNCPVHFKGEKDDLDGDLVMVMYEDHPDPIIGGRETMGYSKIYADIQSIEHDEQYYRSGASEWDFKFMNMEIDTSRPAADQKTFMANEARSQGKLHLKYFPKTMEKGGDPATNFTEPDVCYPTILPKWVKPDDYPYETIDPKPVYCDGKVEFYEPTWEQMPTYQGVCKGLSSLTVKRVIGAKHVFYSDPCHYTTCYRLR